MSFHLSGSEYSACLFKFLPYILVTNVMWRFKLVWKCNYKLVHCVLTAAAHVIRQHIMSTEWKLVFRENYQ